MKPYTFLVFLAFFAFTSFSANINIGSLDYNTVSICDLEISVALAAQLPHQTEGLTDYYLLVSMTNGRPESFDIPALSLVTLLLPGIEPIEFSLYKVDQQTSSSIDFSPASSALLPPYSSSSYLLKIVTSVTATEISHSLESGISSLQSLYGNVDIDNLIGKIIDNTSPQPLTYVLGHLGYRYEYSGVLCDTFFAQLLDPSSSTSSNGGTDTTRDPTVSNTTTVTDPSESESCDIEVAQEASVGDTVPVSVICNGSSAPNKAIKVIMPYGNSLELESDDAGKTSFLAQDEGKYELYLAEYGSLNSKKLTVSKLLFLERELRDNPVLVLLGGTAVTGFSVLLLFSAALALVYLYMRTRKDK